MRFSYAEAMTDFEFYIPLAKAAEAAGYAAMTIPDSVAYPFESDSTYTNDRPCCWFDEYVLLSGFLKLVGHQPTVKVIVQYKQVPSATHYATMQGRGGRLHAKLHVIKGAAFTIPVSALPALEADPEIASVTIDHSLKGMDDIPTLRWM